MFAQAAERLKRIRQLGIRLSRARWRAEVIFQTEVPPSRHCPACPGNDGMGMIENSNDDALKLLADHLFAFGPECLGVIGIERIGADAVAQVRVILQLGDMAVFAIFPTDRIG